MARPKAIFNAFSRRLKTGAPKKLILNYFTKFSRARKSCTPGQFISLSKLVLILYNILIMNCGFAAIHYKYQLSPLNIILIKSPTEQIFTCCSICLIEHPKGSQSLFALYRLSSITLSRQPRR